MQPWLLALTTATQAPIPCLLPPPCVCVLLPLCASCCHCVCLAATGVCAAAGLGLCAPGRQHTTEAAPGDLRRVQQPPLHLPAAHEHSCWGAGSQPHGSQQSGEGQGGKPRLVAAGRFTRNMQNFGCVGDQSHDLHATMCAAQHTGTTLYSWGVLAGCQAAAQTCASVVVPACLVHRLCLTIPGTLHTTCKHRTGRTAWVRHVTWQCTAWWAQV